MDKLEGKLGALAEPTLAESERECSVAEYMLPTGEWNWERVSKHLPDRYRHAVAAVRCAVHEPKEDKLIWSQTKSGTLTATSAYGMMSSME